MTADWLLGWWNLLYIVPFGLAIAYLVVYAASGLTFGDAEAHIDVDADTDAAAGAHFDHDLDSDPGTSATADAGHGSAYAEPESEVRHDVTMSAAGDDAGAVKAMLLWLGVGRVPLSVLLMVFLLAWGAAGFIVNQVARTAVYGDWRVVALSLPAAFLGAILATRLTVSAIGRWLPLDESTARRRHDLLGLVGVALYTIDETFGMVSVRDDLGELYQVPCRVTRGADSIPKNAPAVLVAYNARQNLYRVEPPQATPAPP